MTSLTKTVAEADLGPWRFVVTADGASGFHEEHAFRSRRACEAERGALERGLARVAADGGARMGGLARRLRLGPCEAVRRPSR
jgi:hypothetical protein